MAHLAWIKWRWLRRKTKLVNGERVELTPEENAARDAEEAAWVETEMTSKRNTTSTK